MLTKISENESRVLEWVKRVVEEAWSSMDREDEVQCTTLNAAELGVAVVKIWARIFKRNVQWQFINIIGMSLEIYARELEEELVSKHCSIRLPQSFS